MTEADSPVWLMHGAREAVASGLLGHLERQVASIENAITSDTGLVFDLAKSLVESACRAVLDERSVSYTVNEDLPGLFRRLSDCLPFLPPEASAEVGVRKSLLQTLSGLRQAVQGICELRNSLGTVSHGSSRARPAMERAQALLAAQAADTIVGFLHGVHRQGRPEAVTPLPTFDQHADFNDWVDAENPPARVFEVEFRPSEILFHLEPETYRVYLAEFDPASVDQGGAE